MTPQEIFLLILALLVFGWLVSRFFFRRETIFETERGLLFSDGKYLRTLMPGRHWRYTPRQTLQKVDIRLRSVTIPGQELLTSDNVSIKISLAVSFRIVDPYKATVEALNVQEEIYLHLQVQLRDLVGAIPVEELLAKRKSISDLLLENTRARAAELGLELVMVSIKDIMFPGELKNIFAQVVNARNEGLAALERARGETAALRNLANAAQMIKDNPALYQLRVLQSINSSSGNTIILSASPDGSLPAVIPAEGKHHKK